MDKYEILQNMIKHSNKIVFFTGAGISTLSGIPDFRSANGIFSQKYKMNLSPEEVVSHSYYKNNKEEFYAFYKEKMMYPNATPNIAHLFIASLQNNHDVKVITQNIDALHTKAGSKYVIELHGSVERNYCEKCHSFFNGEYVYKSRGIPKCDKCGGDIKPDVVLYEEALDQDCIINAIKALEQADLLIVIGTSLRVYPAANFISYFGGQASVIINKDKTNYDEKCDLVFNEDIGEVISHIWQNK